MAHRSTGTTEGGTGATAGGSDATEDGTDATEDGTDAPADPGETGGHRARRWVLAAVTFVLGVFVGAIALGLLMESPPRDLVTGEGGAAAPTEADRGATAEIGVNEACLRVINAAQDTVEAIEDLGRSAADLDLVGLNEVIRRLQPLQGRLQQDLEVCRVDTTLPEDLDPAGVPGEDDPPAEGEAPVEGEAPAEDQPEEDGTTEDPASPTD